MIQARCISIGRTTHESSPAFTSLISALYVGMGEDPVGKPRTKGFDGVGSNRLILCRRKSELVKLFPV